MTRTSYQVGDVVVVKIRSCYYTSPGTTCDVIDQDGVLYAKSRDKGIALKLSDVLQNNAVELAPKALAWYFRGIINPEHPTEASVIADSTDKPKKLRPLTTKQAKFVKAKAQGLTGVAAAQIAYPTVDYNTARAIASENLAKPNINEAVQAEMAKQGITLEAIIAPLKDALTAEKVHIVGNGEQAMADVVPDHSVRLKAVSIASQFMGVGKGDQVPGGVHFHQHVNDKKADYKF